MILRNLAGQPLKEVRRLAQVGVSRKGRRPRFNARPCRPLHGRPSLQSLALAQMAHKEGIVGSGGGWLAVKLAYNFTAEVWDALHEKLPPLTAVSCGSRPAA